MRDLSKTPIIGIVGLGYVGLPTALALLPKGVRVIGYDISAERISAVHTGAVDLIPADHQRLAEFGTSANLTMTTDPRSLCEADTILICVPTPVDEHHNPDLRALRGACETVVRNSRHGQTIVLTSTVYPGCTLELLVEPLTTKGFTVGENIHVAFSPERIDPGNTQDVQETVPRVIGGHTQACAESAALSIGLVAPKVHFVGNTTEAELAKLLENTFRAVNITLVNEYAEVSSALGVDITRVVAAAATKPYGFMSFKPGPGVGGHCIPADPHYLLAHLPNGVTTPVVSAAMQGIIKRPARIVRTVVDELNKIGQPVNNARICVVGVAFKPNVADIRDTPATQIVDGLIRRGAYVTYFDPMVKEFSAGGRPIQRAHPDASIYDAVVVLVTHDGHDYTWIDQGGNTLVIDASYQMDAIKQRILP